MNFQPMFFSGCGGRLYGVLHYPDPGKGNEQAILIMPPMGHEYVRCHKTLQKLATDLARKGYHVLRFDYLGSGDSSDNDTQDLETWRLNGLDALRQLSEWGETRRLSVVGVRLGASLAVCMDVDLESLVLWDPIGNGENYLRQLELLSSELLDTTLHSLRSRKPNTILKNELVGHKLTTAMRKSLIEFRPEANMKTQANRIIWVDTGGCRSETEFSFYQDLLAMGSLRRPLDMQCHWRSRAELGKTLMGQPAARMILDCFSTVHADNRRGV